LPQLTLRAAILKVVAPHFPAALTFDGASDELKVSPHFRTFSCRQKCGVLTPFKYEIEDCFVN
jgi:hypothetical protein